MLIVIKKITDFMEGLANFIKSDPMSIKWEVMFGVVTFQIGLIGLICGGLLIAYVLLVSKYLRKELDELDKLLLSKKTTEEEKGQENLTKKRGPGCRLPRSSLFTLCLGVQMLIAYYIIHQNHQLLNP